jgi:DNA-binding MarR family transcriptional regulator
MEAEFNKRLSGYEVTRVSWAVLGAITYDGKTTPSELADFLKIDRAAITRLLDKLDDQGLVSRTRRDSDRRSVTLQVTPKGKALSADLLQLSNSVNELFVTGLSPKEAEQYIATVKKMLANGDKSVGTL